MIQMNIEPGNKYDPVCETTGEHSIVSPYSKSFRESNPVVKVPKMAMYQQRIKKIDEPTNRRITLSLETRWMGGQGAQNY